VGDFPFTRLETGFAYENSLLTFEGGLLMKVPGGPRWRWQGRLPLQLSLNPWRFSWEDAEMHVLVKAENADLDLLPAFFGELQEATGPLDLTWGPGAIRVHRAGTAYRLQPGLIRLEGDTLAIPEIVLKSQGTMRLSGQVKLAGLSPRWVEAKAVLHNFKALERAGSEVFASGRADLEGPWEKPVLTGSLTLTQGSFRTAFFQRERNEDIVLVRQASAARPGSGRECRSSKPGFYRHLALDLGLTSPEGVWVMSKRMKIKVAGNLKLHKASGEEKVRAKGHLKVKEGSVTLHGREFKVVRGEVDLPGLPGSTPTADLRAVSQISDVTLVVFGRPAHTLTQQQFRTMGEHAVGILGGLTAKKLKEFLGKDIPLVGDIYVQGSMESVGVVKPLTKDLTVSFERKTEPLARDDTNRMRVDYRLNRYLKLESQLGRRNSGADVLFNVDF